MHLRYRSKIFKTHNLYITRKFKIVRDQVQTYLLYSTDSRMQILRISLNNLENRERKYLKIFCFHI